MRREESNGNDRVILCSFYVSMCVQFFIGAKWQNMLQRCRNYLLSLDFIDKDNKILYFAILLGADIEHRRTA